LIYTKDVWTRASSVPEERKSDSENLVRKSGQTGKKNEHFPSSTFSSLTIGVNARSYVYKHLHPLPCSAQKTQWRQQCFPNRE